MRMHVCHSGHLMTVTFGYRVHVWVCFLNHDTTQCDMIWKRIQLCSYVNSPEDPI